MRGIRQLVSLPRSPTIWLNSHSPCPAASSPKVTWTQAPTPHKIRGMWLVVAPGLVSVCVSRVFEPVVRLRRGVFWQGGSLDYGSYLRLRKEKCPSPLRPVYLIAPLLLFGIGCIIFGLLKT